MCMCVFVYVCVIVIVCVYVCVCIYECVYVCACVYICVYVYLCVYVFMCVYMCVCVCVCVCVFHMSLYLIINVMTCTVGRIGQSALRLDAAWTVQRSNPGGGRDFTHPSIPP